MFDFVLRQLEHVYGFSPKRIEEVATDVAEFANEELEDYAFVHDDYLLAFTFARFMREGCVEKQLHEAALKVVKRQTYLLLSDDAVVRARANATFIGGSVQ